MDGGEERNSDNLEGFSCYHSNNTIFFQSHLLCAIIDNEEPFEAFEEVNFRTECCQRERESECE